MNNISTKKELSNKPEINYKNIISFIEGNLKFYKSKIVNLPNHIKEQYYYRLYQCKDTCLKDNACEICNCPPVKKAFVSESCNPGKILDLMEAYKWEQYKRDHNITVEMLMNIKNTIDDVIREKK